MPDNFKMRLNDHREDLLERVEKEIVPEIERDSRTAGVEVAIRKGLEWFRLREEKRQEKKSLEDEIQELERDWDL